MGVVDLLPTLSSNLKMSLDEETMMILSNMALYCTMTEVLASETMYERTLRKTVGKSQPPRRRSAHNSENHVNFTANFEKKHTPQQTPVAMSLELNAGLSEHAIKIPSGIPNS